MLWSTLVSQFHLGSEGFTQLFRDGDNTWTKSSVLVVVVDLYEDGRWAVQNENGLGAFLLPSSVVGKVQLNVLHDSGGVNRGLPPANSDCATDRHLPAHEKHRRQASRCIHVGNFEQQVPHRQDVSIVHIADVILGCVQK